MNPSMISLCLASVYLTLGIVCSGCDSKAQKQQAADQAAVDEFKAYQQETQERLTRQIESGEGYAPDSTESLDRYVELVEKTSQDVSPELAAQLTSQAAIIKEFKGLLDPYLAIDQKFLELGGIDASTLASIEDIDQRVAMIRDLNTMNERIDARFPELFMQIKGADSPDGRRQLEMTSAIRQTNREAFPHMMQSLQIVRKHWETSGNADDGVFYFGNTVPDADIQAYNAHIQAVDALAVKQTEIQRRYYQTPKQAP